jgi:hypothetical protein
MAFDFTYLATRQANSRSFELRLARYAFADHLQFAALTSRISAVCISRPGTDALHVDVVPAGPCGMRSTRTFAFFLQQ